MKGHWTDTKVLKANTPKKVSNSDFTCRHVTASVYGFIACECISVLINLRSLILINPSFFTLPHMLDTPHASAHIRCCRFTTPVWLKTLLLSGRSRLASFEAVQLQFPLFVSRYFNYTSSPHIFYDGHKPKAEQSRNIKALFKASLLLWEERKWGTLSTEP